MIAHQMLVEVLHVPAPVHPAIQLPHQLRSRRRNPLRRRLAEPAVDQPLKPLFLVAIPVPPELPLRQPENLPSLQHR
jgi:hypothetical protein